MAEEKLLSLTDAARLLPATNGKRPHTSSLWRWARKGLKGVRLEYARVGNRICTSSEALSRFVNALAQADQHPKQTAHAPAVAGQTPAVRNHAVTQAYATLKDAGI